MAADKCLKAKTLQAEFQKDYKHRHAPAPSKPHPIPSTSTDDCQNAFSATQHECQSYRLPTVIDDSARIQSSAAINQT
eukprot:5466119-Amphidinium_carterae.1